MAKKIYIYDSFGGDLLTCEYEGLGSDGKPCITILTPGCPVENFLEHLGMYGKEADNYHLLCEENQTADVRLVVEMMGTFLIEAIRPYEKMLNRLDEMRKLGIGYDHEVQKLTVRISEFNDVETKEKSYHLLMYVGMHNSYIGDKYYDDLTDLIVDMRDFCLFIESRVQIPLKKRLESSESLNKKVKQHSIKLFDEIVTI